MSRLMVCLCLAGCFLFALTLASADDKPNAAKPNGNRLTYLDEPCNPWYPHRDFPKLTTPMWVGEEGVEAIVLLGIDDMRGHEKWEAYLRPILNRLKQIDGRAPVSIFTCSIDPKHPHLQQWLEEGLSLEVHTIDHPCPLLNSGDLAKAKSTVDRCIELLNEVPNNKPVCFRTPCCDSLNTLSPRYFTEIFAKTTEKGHFLQADSSVMQVFTSDDPDLPRELVLEPDAQASRERQRPANEVPGLTPSGSPDAGGKPATRERFRKYLPTDRFFANSIENYPYPFVIDRLCWEFPCTVPSDWAAQHLHKPHNPQTVEDWKAALDCTVIKQGVFCLVFHPHNWIKPEQINELIDHAVTKHGKKIKFLTFKDAVERLNKHVLGGQTLRDKEGKDNGVRLADLDNDGYLDVAIGNNSKSMTRAWQQENSNFRESSLPPVLLREEHVVFGVSQPRSSAFLISFGKTAGAWKWNDPWIASDKYQEEEFKTRYDVFIRNGMRPRLFDSDHDGESELAMTNRELDGRLAPMSASGIRDNGIRFVDLDSDGFLDRIESTPQQYDVSLWVQSKNESDRGWHLTILSGQRGSKPANEELPPIVRADGSNNGFWVHSRNLVWMNEDTAKAKDLVERRSFDDLLAKGGVGSGEGGEKNKTKTDSNASAPPSPLPTPHSDGPKSPEESLKLMQVKPGYRVELVAAEPLVRDPVAFDWGPDGKLWVAEMADYPLGVGEGEEADNADASLRSRHARRDEPKRDQPSNGQPAPASEKGQKADKESTSKERSAHHGERDGYKKGGGRVRFLEDTDGDGKYDKSTVFLDKLNFPNGVMPWRDGVLISAAPDVLFARDTNGDGRADEVKVLLTGFGEGNQQHRVNGFSWGLDNMVHCANGDSGGSIKVVASVPRPSGSGPIATTQPLPDGRGTDAGFLGKTIDIRGRDFRWNPDTGEIDPTTGQTQFGRNRDDFGDWFGNNNANPMYHFVLDDYYIRRNPHVAPPDPRKQVSVVPGPSPVFPISRTLARFNDFAMANRFTSANSAMVYRDELLFERSRHAPRDEPSRNDAPKGEKRPPTESTPKERSARHAERDGYVAHVFISEPVHNLVHHEIMTADGVTFTSRRADDEQQSEFLASKDNWFRPTQIKTGPDGALYIADMYRQVIEHPQYIPPAMQEKLDLRAGHDKGRIYRVVRSDAPYANTPRHHEAEEPLPWPINKADGIELYYALRSSNGTIRDLAHRMLWWKIADGQKPFPVSTALDETIPLARLHVISILDSIGLLDWQSLSQALQDRHPAVRRRTVQAVENFAGELPPPLVNQLSGMGHDPDPFVRMQFAYTLGHPKFAHLGNELGKLLYRERDDKYLVAAAMSSIHEKNVGSVVANVLELAATEKDATGQNASRGATSPTLANTLLNLAATLGNEQALLSLIEYVVSGAATTEAQPAMLAQVLEALDRRGTSLSQLKGIPPQRLARAEQQLAKRIEAARAEISNFKSQISNNSEIKNQKSKIENDVIASLPLLGRVPGQRGDDAKLVGALLVPQAPVAVQSAGVATLARINHADSALALLSGWRPFTPTLRTQVLDALLSRTSWTDKLLDALEAKSIAPSDIDAARRQRLIAHSNEAIRNRAAKLLEISANVDRQKVVAEFAAKLRDGNITGDATRGAEIFKKRCATCHKLKEIGTSVGSDLMSLTDKSQAALLTAILDPNKAVEAKFLTYIAINKQGQTFSGMIAAETGNSITLVGNDGKPNTLLRADLEDFISSNRSLMPEGFEKDVSPNELADVIAFVQSSGPPPKKFDGNQPEPVTADANGTLRLLATNAEIYGKTLVFEPQFKNLGYWGSFDDRAVWTINVTKPGKHSIRLNYACDNSTAGNEVVFAIGDQSVKAKIVGTGSWENYQTAILGGFDLPAGQHRLTVRATETLMNHLMDLKELRLVPE